MPLAAIIGKDNNSGILRANDGHGGKRGLLVLRVVQGIVRHLHIRIRLVAVYIQVVSAGPGEDEIAKEAEQKQVARPGRLGPVDIGGVINLNYVLILWVNVHIHW